MIGRLLLCTALFAVAFAIARLIPIGEQAPATKSPDAGSARAPSDLHETTPPAEFAKTASVPNPGLAQATKVEQSPWLTHVMRDPEHHARDANRISRAVFDDADVWADLAECEHMFPTVETKLRLRTTVRISRETIEIYPVEEVQVVDGVELTDQARACIVTVFRRGAQTTPAYPDFVLPYHGPYDLTASVVRQDDEPSPTGDAE